MGALIVPLALSTQSLAGAGLVAAGIAWVFFFPRVESQMGLELGKLKATRLSAGALMVVIGAVLIHLDSEGGSNVREPAIASVVLTTADGQSAVDASVRCPFTVDLTGQIGVKGGKGEVAYRFVRQEFNGPEEASPIENFTVNGPTSHTVRDSYTFNVPNGELFREDRLDIVSPETLSSDAVRMTVNCNANLPPGPPTPPPDVPNGEGP